jgi:F-type H+/Na+-transporting ATPase subunit beta
VVATEELTQRLSGGPDRVCLFSLVPLMPNWPANGSFADVLKKEAGEGTVGSVETFFLRAQDRLWSRDRLAALAAVDTIIHLSRERFHALMYPAVDVLASRSRLIENRVVGKDHAMIGERVLQAIAALWGVDRQFESYAGDDKLILERALKLQNYFTQPFFIAAPYTKRPGTTVRLAESLQTCRDILNGRDDDLPTDAFYFSASDRPHLTVPAAAP